MVMNGWEMHVFPSSLFRMCMCSNECVQLHVYLYSIVYGCVRVCVCLYSIVCVRGGWGCRWWCKTTLKDRVIELKIKAIELR
jgi:hypothetical protein